MKNWSNKNELDKKINVDKLKIIKRNNFNKESVKKCVYQNSFYQEDVRIKFSYMKPDGFMYAKKLCTQKFSNHRLNIFLWNIIVNTVDMVTKSVCGGGAGVWWVGLVRNRR